MPNTYHYFASVNGYNGFVPLLDYVFAEDDTVYVLKGGAGNGKSTFMKQVGAHFEQIGDTVEYFHCAADPQSIDGIRAADRKLAIVDGTAPHIIEPKISGCSGAYIDFSRFCDMSHGKKIREELENIEYIRKQETQRAYALLCAAGKLRENMFESAYNENCFNTVRRRAEGIAAREFKTKGKNGTAIIRALSAFTYEGNTSFLKSAVEEYEKIYYIDNRFGLGKILLNRLIECAENSGEYVIKCISPMDMREYQALLLPKKGTAFICGCDFDAFDNVYRHIRLDSLIKPNLSYVKRIRKIYSDTLELARFHLENAKKLHDDLENKLRAGVDYNALCAYTENIVSVL